MTTTTVTTTPVSSHTKDDRTGMNTRLRVSGMLKVKKNEASTSTMVEDTTTGGEEGEEKHRNTLLWWATLCVISMFNMAVWLYSYRTLSLAFVELDDAGDGQQHYYYSYQQSHLVLSGIYVFVCAYRSFLPRIDLERYCLWDTPLSSIFLGRSAATVAEICFAGQMALFLHRLGTVHDHPYSIYLSYVLVPAITMAQCFCWCGVITLNHLYHAIEESIWAIGALFVAVEMGSLVLYHPENQYLCKIGLLGCVMCLSFFWFMITVDVPMYLHRWQEGLMETSVVKMNVGMTFTRIALPPRPCRMTSMDGGRDALRRRVVTKSWDVWKEETVWLTGYFSSAVWLSLLFIHLPVVIK